MDKEQDSGTVSKEQLLVTEELAHSGEVALIEELESYEIDYNALDLNKKRQAASQDLFLRTFEGEGTMKATARVMGISIATVALWRKDNPLSFNERFAKAEQGWRETLEAKAWSRITDPTGNRGSDALLIFMLKANWKEKYGEVSISLDSDSKKVLQQLQQIRKQSNKDSESGRVEEQENVSSIDSMRRKALES